MAAVASYCKPSPFVTGQSHPRLGKSPLRLHVGISEKASRVTALFWGPKKSVEPQQLETSLGDFTLTGSGQEEVLGNQMMPKTISISVVSSISEVSSDEWDACTSDATGSEKFNPFLTHGFLSSLEESRSAVKETGWMPSHVVARDESKNVLGVVPLYLKSHSNGEFVFDYSWADAYYSFGARYYPKFQCCVPFTPVTGPRILIRNTSFKDQLFDVIVSSLKDLTAKARVSSLHITFPSETEWHKLKEKGFLQRTGMQYHWKNRNYKKNDCEILLFQSCCIKLMQEEARTTNG
ncbi:uncharacterized protein LOC110809945 isoform X3 [Carica papaya]|uniref:uncharacterized protein LOC110809945 isoform X3 n=1 Tax=Carica papaya TaxID=3649 RepID=UPI000B8D06AA|nr:uncharacterized protein LOC110809945 isoform X3 [Carica papaya]